MITDAYVQLVDAVTFRTNMLLGLMKSIFVDSQSVVLAWIGLKPTEFHWKKQECANPSCDLRCSTFDNVISNTLDIFRVLVHQLSREDRRHRQRRRIKNWRRRRFSTRENTDPFEFYSMYLCKCSSLPLSLRADQWRRSSPRICSTKSIWSFKGIPAANMWSRCRTTKNNKCADVEDELSVRHCFSLIEMEYGSFPWPR